MIKQAFSDQLDADNKDLTDQKAAKTAAAEGKGQLRTFMDESNSRESNG